MRLLYSKLWQKCPILTKDTEPSPVLLADFKSGEVELYGHIGFFKGYSTSKVTYSSGFIGNYSEAGSYSGLFYQYGAGYLFGLNRCLDPSTDYDNAVNATMITFGSGGYFGEEIDWYFDPISFVRKKPRLYPLK